MGGPMGGTIGGTIGGAMGGAIGGAMGGAIEGLTERQMAILFIIANNNKISYRKLAKQLEINESAVLKHIEVLKDKNYIERVGGTRGHWKVNLSKS